MTTPAGWESTTLGTLGRYINGRGFKKTEWRTEGRPIIRIQNLTGSSQAFNYFDGEADERHVVQPGDLLVSWAATLGAYFWTGPEAVLNQHIFKVESNIDPKFHKYLLDHKFDELMSHTHGSGMVHITRGAFDSLPVSIPPLDQQGRIVELLEDHLSRLDAADSYLKQARGHLHALRMSRLAALEGPGVELAGLGELTSGEPRAITDGPFGSKLASRHYTQEGPRVVRLENIGDGIFLDEATHIDEEHFETLRRHEVEADDLIVASLGTGRIRACLAPPDLGPAIVKADCIRVRLGPDVDPRYVLHSLGRPQLKHWAENLRHGVGRPRLGMAGVKALPVPLPPLHAQREIAAELDEADRVASRLSEGLDASLARSSLLRRSLLTAAFAGRLTSGYADESDLTEPITAQELRGSPRV